MKSNKLRLVSTESSRLINLSIPIILAQIGNILLNLVDTYIVGQYNAVELAGVAAGNSIFSTIFMAGFGMLMGLDPLLTRMQAKGENDQLRRLLGQSVYLSLVIGIACLPIAFFGHYIFPLIGAEADLTSSAESYLKTVIFSLPFALVFVAYQRYWQALESPYLVTWVILLSNLVNYFLNSILVPGFGSIPAFGATGAGLATLGCRIFQLIAIIYFGNRLAKKRAQALPSIRECLKANKEFLLPLLKIGSPASLQMTFEVFAFNAGAFIAAKLGTLQLAGHHIVLQIVSFTFMFPVGIATATAVRVGVYNGKEDHDKARLTGWLGIGFAALVMACFALLLLTAPKTLITIFTSDEEVIAIALGITFLCAVFQIVDGIQVAAASALRGLGNTKISLVTNFCCFYLCGLPLAIYLSLYTSLGIKGLWIGLATSLFLTAIANTSAWFWYSLFNED